MYNIEVVKHIVCYEQRDFINQLISTIKILEDDKLEVDIKYAMNNNIFTALIIGRRQTEAKIEEQRTIAPTNIDEPKLNRLAGDKQIYSKKAKPKK